MNLSALLTARTVCALVLLPLLFGITGAVSPAVTGITPDSEENTTRIFTANISGSDFAAGAQVLLVPSAAGPIHAGSITDGGSIAPFLNGPQAVSLSGTTAYVVSQLSNALEIIDVSDPAHPVHKGSLANGTGGALLRAPMGVAVSGTYAYVASSGSNALEIIDVSDPAHPVHAGSLVNGTEGTLLNNPQSVAVSGRHAYVTGYGSSTLEIVNISDPAAPAHEGTIKDDTLLKNPTSVFVAGNYAYVTSSGNNALEIVDISNPSNPFHKGTLKDGNGNAPFLKTPKNVYVLGNFAYVASSGSNALEIVDVANPATPVHKAGIRNGVGGAWLGSPVGVYVSGHYAYIASSGSNALEIVDISNPAVPIHLGTLLHGSGGALLDFPDSVSVSGPYAYVTGRTGNSLEIADIGSVISIPADHIMVRPGTAITSTFNLTGAMAGKYTVVVANPGSPPGTLAGGFTITAPLPPPRLTGITPAGGTGSASVRITDLAGSDFNTTVTPSVKLNRTGFADIIATNVTVLRSTQLTCWLDLTGREAGSWNVVVTNPDGQEGILPGGFSVFPQLPTTPPTTVPTLLPTIAETGSSLPESGMPGRGTSSVITSPGAAAGEIVSFEFGKSGNVEFSGYPYAITKVTFIPTSSLGPTDLILADAGMTEQPPGDGRITAGMVFIEPVAVNPSVLRFGTITFAVADPWLRSKDLTPAHIVLMRQEEGAWSELPTTYLYRSGDTHYFTATTPGFSYLAISTRGPITPANAPATINTAIPSPVTPRVVTLGISGASSGTPDVPMSGDGMPMVTPARVKNDIPQAAGTFTIVTAVGSACIATAGGLYLRRWWIRRQNPVLFRKND